MAPATIVNFYRDFHYGNTAIHGGLKRGRGCVEQTTRRRYLRQSDERCDLSSSRLSKGVFGGTRPKTPSDGDRGSGGGGVSATPTPNAPLLGAGPALAAPVPERLHPAGGLFGSFADGVLLGAAHEAEVCKVLVHDGVLERVCVQKDVVQRSDVAGSTRRSLDPNE